MALYWQDFGNGENIIGQQNLFEKQNLFENKSSDPGQTALPKNELHHRTHSVPVVSLSHNKMAYTAKSVTSIFKWRGTERCMCSGAVLEILLPRQKIIASVA